MRLYLAGPMTGLEFLNFPAFMAEAARLRALGHTVLNPAELCPDPTTQWEDCMRKDIAALVTCEALALLPGWPNSKGAQLEVHIAEALGMAVYEAHEIVRENASEGAHEGYVLGPG